LGGLRSVKAGRSGLQGRAGPLLLILDEVQKVRGWSDTLKALWEARGDGVHEVDFFSRDAGSWLV